MQNRINKNPHPACCATLSRIAGEGKERSDPLSLWERVPVGRVRAVFISLMLSVPLSLFAHTSALHSEQPITIQSDTASVEQLKHHAVHEGNVILTQGLHTLCADRLTIQKDLKGNLSVITATGNPARFSGKKENEIEPLLATAKIIYYYPDKQLVVLEGAATLEHQQDKFQGPSLRYQLDKQVISATSQSQDRPTVTLHPRG